MARPHETKRRVRKVREREKNYDNKDKTEIPEQLGSRGTDTTNASHYSLSLFVSERLAGQNPKKGAALAAEAAASATTRASHEHRTHPEREGERESEKESER